MAQITKIEDLPLNWGEVEPAETEIICDVDDNECVIFETSDQNATNDTYHHEESIPNNNIIYPDVGTNGNNPNDCVIYLPEEQASQSFTNDTGSSTNNQVIQYQFPENEYLDIQVTEEVVSGVWDNGQDGVSDNLTLPGDVKLVLNQLWEDEVEIPLPQDQDSYASRPFPCDFCNRRFSKKANLMNHMVSHQVDRPHLCNLCGARYRRKLELISHMKIHAFVPGKETVSEDEEEEEEEEEDDDDEENDVSELPDIEHKIKRTKNKSKRGRKSLNHNNKYNNENFMNNNSTNKSYKYSKKHSNFSHHYDSDKLDLDPLEIPEASTSESLEHRWPITDPSRPYVCQHCGVGFAREKALISHSRIHAGDSPYECNTCGEMFWDVTMLKDHAQSKHGVRLTLNNVNTKQEDEDYYPNEETSEDYNEFYCDVCGNVFHRWDLLKRHKRVHMKFDAIDSPYFCEMCDEAFTNQEQYMAHVETHPQQKENRCMICGECFIDTDTLAQHVRKKHPKDLRPYACTYCGKLCKSKQSLKKHISVHSSDKIYSCTECGKRFHSHPRLKRHMLSHRDKEVTCDECGKIFPDGRALLNHRHSHNKDNSSRQFHCFECDKTFGSRSSQQIHARIHTGERPYGCRYCWKAFADGGTLRKHERIHTGEKPYACPICPRAFNQRVVLREHIRSHHSGPDVGGGTHSPLFVCRVCSGTFSRSQDLCQHLIAHSDENTAKNRTPRFGQRKYKRRKRLNNHELNLITVKMDPDDSLPNDFNDSYSSNYHNDRMEDYDDSDDDYGKKKTKRKSKSRTSRQHVSDDFESVVKSFESVMENFNSIVDSSKSEARKAKLKRKNHRMKKYEQLDVDEEQQQQQPQATSSASPIKSPSKIASFASGGFIKSNRPIGEGRIRPRTKNVTLSTLAALKAVNVITPRDPSAEQIIRGGPRTKNVNYHNVKMVKLEPATFDDYKQPPLKPTTPPLEIPPSPPPSIHLQSPTSISNQPSTKIQLPPFIGKVEVEDGVVDMTTDDQIEYNHIEEKQSQSPTTKTTTATTSDDNEKHNQILCETNNLLDIKPMQLLNGEKKNKTKNDKSNDVDTSLVKVEYKCEMCSETFTKRADLLIHVPIHI